MATTPTLETLRVRDLMTPDVVTLTRRQSLPTAESYMALARVRHLPVVDDEQRLVGLVTHRDLLRAQISNLAPLDESERNELQLDVPVEKIMHTEVWTVDPDASATTAARLLVDHRFGCLPVVREGRLVGIVTEADFLELFASDPPPRLTTAAPARVGELMSTAPISLTVSATIAEARFAMQEHGVHHLPLVRDDEPVGIVSDRDLAIAEAAHGGREAAAHVSLGTLSSSSLFVVSPDARLDAVVLDMATARHGSALVVEAGELVGILTLNDVARFLATLLRESSPLPEP